MTVLCNNVNYYSRGEHDVNGELVQKTAAQVTFNATTGSDVESFSIVFRNIQEPIPYFPGVEYTLELNPVQE